MKKYQSGLFFLAALVFSLFSSTLVAAQGMSGMSGMSGMGGMSKTGNYAFTVPGVAFNHGSATITDEAKELLRQKLAEIPNLRGVRFLVVGHSDSYGDDAYNLYLSRERAKSIKQYLVDNGIPAPMVETVGKGASEPVADNASVEGRRKNRRVDLFLY